MAWTGNTFLVPTYNHIVWSGLVSCLLSLWGVTASEKENITKNRDDCIVFWGRGHTNNTKSKSLRRINLNIIMIQYFFYSKIEIYSKRLSEATSMLKAEWKKKLSDLWVFHIGGGWLLFCYIIPKLWWDPRPANGSGWIFISLNCFWLWGKTAIEWKKLQLTLQQRSTRL